MIKIFVFLSYYMKAKFFWHFKDRSDLEKHQHQQSLKLNQFLQKQKYQFGDKIITKSFFLDNFHQFNRFGASKDLCVQIALEAEKNRDFLKHHQLSDENGVRYDISLGLSSGTSGNRGVFITTSKERVAWAAIILAKMLPVKLFLKALNPFKPRVNIAFFLRANNNLYTSLNAFGFTLHYFDMTLPYESHLERLDALNPDILVAPASVLYSMAKTKKAGGLKIKPNLIISVAEVLEHQSYIEQQFGTMVRQVYQCTEGFLAYTCEHGSTHLNESFVKIDLHPVDGKSRYQPIITDFTRQSQFIHLFKHDDILVHTGKTCPCGSAELVIDQIEGRMDETINIRNRSIFPDTIRQLFYASDHEINNWTLTKRGHEFTVALDPNTKENREYITQALTKLIRSHDLEFFFVIQFTDYINDDFSKKKKRIINL